ncbi:Rec8 like protein-domain-containing protein [Podospora appendiculata]|uniref:Rec8 like protein-domain-containing protein n=1 Tax=Podospora appendiculata TaxID=314037 RepID=A0AAE1CIH2_9PEZI|nr:Rec8 like protein-domain-containing protein [Podospora appendiculata]
MFWSGTLLGATGPLAKAWLSANQERKVSKTQILQLNLQDSVDAIITPNDAPLALRLSGQLLLGVVRIYSRKARYLLDDCNEALMKIKMAFRSTGNHDIPTNLHIQNKELLMLPDRITPYDNLDLLPPPNADFLSSQLEDVTATPFGNRKGRSSNRDINLQEDFNNSQFLQDNTGDDNEELALANMDDLELELDFGIDIDDRPSKLMDTTIEMGRDAPAARSIEDDMFSEMDIAGPSKDRRTHEPSPGLDLDFGEGVHIADDEGDIQMADDDLVYDLGNQSAMPEARASARTAIPDMSRARISESPLSDIDENFAKEVEMEYSRHLNTDMYEPGEDPTAETVVAPQRSKKRKLLQPDDQTMLSNAQIKEQQAKRDNILKPQTFLMHDPYILGLMDLQKNGGFVNHILLEGRSDGWAPELKGLLSLGGIRPNELKRKRDSGIADMESEEEHGASKSPRLELPEDETVMGLDGTIVGNQSEAVDGTVLELGAGDDTVVYHQDDDEGRPQSRDAGSPMAAFDETSAPLVHPADSGPVSIGTKHAVHILRDLFGADAATSAEKRKKTSVVFQDLLPEQRTTKADATKMFFECLVLATKDAIKVEQPEGTLGGQIRIRGKRGLWGDWAEREAGGEIAREQPNEPQRAIESTPAVSVEA